MELIVSNQNQVGSKVSMFKQFYILLTRNAIGSFRNPYSLMARLFLLVAVAGAEMATFWQVGEDETRVNDLIGCLFIVNVN